MQSPSIDTGKERTTELLESSLALARHLLIAQDEDSAILATMRVSADLLNAEGSAFVPFNEWRQTGHILWNGEEDFVQDLDWQALLAAPSTRNNCRSCEKKDSGPDCVLLREVSGVRNVYCVSLRCEGREIGIVNYFFSSKPDITEHQHFFLEEMVRLTDLSLSALRARAQELQTARLAFSPEGLKEQLVALDEKNKFILDQLEYQAVLDERTRIAREIHDGLAQTLAFLKIEAARMQEFISKGEREKVPIMLKACVQTLSDAYLDARQAIDNLSQYPAGSLKDWFATTAKEFNTLTGTEVDVSGVHLTNDLPPNVKVQVIRIVQEALTNVRKHAQACTVTLTAYEGDGEAVIEVHDNGRGFVSEDVKSFSQYGLRSMRERAESVGADFDIISAPSDGTTVQIRIPIKPEVVS